MKFILQQFPSLPTAALNDLMLFIFENIVFPKRLKREALSKFVHCFEELNTYH